MPTYRTEARMRELGWSDPEETFSLNAEIAQLVLMLSSLARNVRLYLEEGGTPALTALLHKLDTVEAMLDGEPREVPK